MRHKFWGDKNSDRVGNYEDHIGFVANDVVDNRRGASMTDMVYPGGTTRVGG